MIAHPFGNLHDFNVFIHELLGPANPLFNDIADKRRPGHAFKELADIGDAVIILLCHLLEGERLRQMLFHIVKDGAHQADMLEAGRVGAHFQVHVTIQASQNPMDDGAGDHLLSGRGTQLLKFIDHMQILLQLEHVQVQNGVVGVLAGEH